MGQRSRPDGFTGELRSSGAYLAHPDAGLLAGASALARRQGIAFAGALPLERYLGGAARFQVMVAERDGTMLAACPVTEVLSDDVVGYFYSFGKVMFESWAGAVGQLDSRLAPHEAKVRAFAKGLREVARFGGLAPSSWLLAAFPTTMLFDVLVRAHVSDAERDAAIRALVVSLSVAGDDANAPVGVLGVDADDHRLRSALRAGGFVEIVCGIDNVLRLEGTSFSDYLATFPSNTRRRWRQERASMAKQHVELLTTPGPFEARGIGALYDATYSRYGDQHFRFDDEYFALLGSHLGEHVSLIEARRDGARVGFSTMLHGDDASIVTLIGEDGDKPVRDLHFSLLVYDAVDRAYALGHKKLGLGLANLLAKRRRGAEHQHRFFYVRPPRSLRGRVLRPLLHAFADGAARLYELPGSEDVNPE